MINSNEAMAARMEELLAQESKPEGFVEGLEAQEIELEPMEPPEPEILPEELLEQARQELEEARAQAEKLVEDAKNQADAVTERARKEGERRGYEVGRQLAAEELKRQETLLMERRQDLEAQFAEMRENLEPQILDAVCDVFEKVFSIQFDQYKQILLHLIKNAILKIESTQEFHVRVGTGNYPYIEEHRNEILSQVGQNIRLAIEADSSLDVSQCVIETDSGFFECGLDVQFENLIKTIRSLSV